MRQCQLQTDMRYVPIRKNTSCHPYIYIYINLYFDNKKVILTVTYVTTVNSVTEKVFVGDKYIIVYESSLT